MQRNIAISTGNIFARRKSDTGIDIPRDVNPYPSKSDHILDKPHVDSPDNFGRLARTGIMDVYKAKLNHVQLCGIKIAYWRQFFKAFQESATDDQIREALEKLSRRIRQPKTPSPKMQSALTIIAELERLLDLAE